MIYVFVPYYHEDTPEFKKSLESQTVPYRLIKRDRKKSKILWTKAVNDFWEDSFNWGKDDDVVCIMNNDIEFDVELFEEGSEVSIGECYVPQGNQVQIDWQNKKFTEGLRIDGFYGRCFFLTLHDFKQTKFSRLLPHALADIDFSIRVVNKIDTTLMGCHIIHDRHSYQDCSKWSWRSYDNPIVWTIFLLRHPNRYTLLNIARCWYDGIFR